MKYCTDCKHYQPSNEYVRTEHCWAPDARTPVGHRQYPHIARAEGGACGVEAKLFEPQPPPPPSPPRVGFWRRLFGRLTTPAI